MTHRIALLVFVLLNSVSVAEAQSEQPRAPILSMTGGMNGWDTTIYPDGRIWAPPSIGDGHTIISVPVFVTNCWIGSQSYPTFPITSFSIPIQFDSGAVEFMGLDTTGHASNFSYTTKVTADTTYMKVVEAPRELRLRGRRVTINGTIVDPSDSLHPTHPNDVDCSSGWFRRLFSLRFKVKADVANDPASIRTPFIITNDSLTYNGYNVTDEVWYDVRNFYDGLAGIDNHYLDAWGIVQIRDPLRPSRRGMIWLEVTDTTGSLAVVDLDTAYINITPDYRWRDTTDGAGFVDIYVSNNVSRSRIADIDVSTMDSWLHFRSGKEGRANEIDPFPRLTQHDTIPFLDNGILGSDDARTPFGEPTVSHPPLLIRLFTAPMPGISNARYQGTLVFESATMAPSIVRLPVVLTIKDTTTSVNWKGAGGEHQQPHVSVFPNPSSGWTTFSINTTQPATVHVYTINGEHVQSFCIEASAGNSAKLILNRLTTGTYTVVVRSGGQTTTAMFTVVN